MAAKFSNKFIGRKTSATLRKVKLIYAFVLSLVLRPQAGADMGHNYSHLSNRRVYLLSMQGKGKFFSEKAICFSDLQISKKKYSKKLS